MISITPAVPSNAALPSEEVVAVSVTSDTAVSPFSQLLKTLHSAEKKPQQGLQDSLPESPISPLSIEGLVPQQVEVRPVLPPEMGSGEPLSVNQMESAPVVTTPLSPELAAVLSLNVVKAEALVAANSPVNEILMGSVPHDFSRPFLDQGAVVPESINASRLSIAVRHPEWGAVLGQRMQSLLQQQANHIQIRLDPPELGKLDVQIQVDDAGTQVVFHTEQREVKEALERAFPRLHEMLSMDNNAGLSFQLGSQNPHGFHHRTSSGEDSVLESKDDLEVGSMADSRQNQPTASLGAIDFYA